MLALGSIFGCFGCGIILSVLSRKNSFILSDLIGIFGVLLGIFINIPTLYISRFILGIVTGLNTTLVPLYIKEYTPIQLRGTIGSLNAICINLGLLSPSFLGLHYPVVPEPNN